MNGFLYNYVKEGNGDKANLLLMYYIYLKENT